MRAISLSEQILALGHRVVLWSADYDHFSHKHRYGRNTKVRVSDSLEIRLIRSRGYERNLGPGRLVDHAQMAFELSRLLRNEDPPDAAFVGYPPIETAAVMTRWLKSAGIPSLVDVKDAWPEIFLRAVPPRLRPIGTLALTGYSHLATRCLRDATGLSSITDDFLAWALSLCGRERRTSDAVFPLTAAPVQITDAALAEAGRWWDEQGVPNDGRLRGYFVGSLHSSYDFAPVAKAAEDSNFQIVVCGAGSSEGEVRALLGDRSNVVMPGWVSRNQAEALARRSTVALAPIAPHPDFMMSLPNKYFDALSKGLPLVTGLSGTITTELTQHNVGMSYGPGSDLTLAECLNVLGSDPLLVKQMSANALALYERQYRHDVVYRRMAEHLTGLTGGHLE